MIISKGKVLKALQEKFPEKSFTRTTRRELVEWYAKYILNDTTKIKIIKLL